MLENLYSPNPEAGCVSPSMQKETPKPLCPHCGNSLSRTAIPVEAAYGTDYFWVCFNDECPYFTRGWTQMWENYNVRASYRFRVNPLTGKEGSLPVWSLEAMKSRIIA